MSEEQTTNVEVSELQAKNEQLTLLLGKACSIINNKDFWVKEITDVQEWYVSNLDVIYNKVSTELKDIIVKKQFNILKMYIDTLPFHEKEVALLLIDSLKTPKIES